MSNLAQAAGASSDLKPQPKIPALNPGHVLFFQLEHYGYKNLPYHKLDYFKVSSRLRLKNNHDTGFRYGLKLSEETTKEGSARYDLGTMPMSTDNKVFISKTLAEEGFNGEDYEVV